MEYLTSAQMGDDADAEARLCEELRTDASAEERALLDRIVYDASVFGEGTIEESDGEATVALEVVFAPAPRDAVGEPWSASLVKEDGRWKVCGFAPREPLHTPTTGSSASVAPTPTDAPLTSNSTAGVDGEPARGSG